MIKFVGYHNITEIWSVNVGNSLQIKHYVMLLQNHGYICSCLSIIRNGVVCRHYFQVMLTTKTALFHIRLIPSRWYYSKELDGSKEPFLVADKFLQEDENITFGHNGLVSYLSNFDQTGKDIYEERLGVLEQKLIYGKLHGIYKKALQKALQNNHKTQQLIDLLQEFAEEEDSNDLSDPGEVLQDDNTSDKENEDPAMVTLQNPKKRRGKGRPLGIKRFKSSHEDSKSIAKNQRRYKNCGNVGHYQKNCKVTNQDH